MKNVLIVAIIVVLLAGITFIVLWCNGVIGSKFIPTELPPVSERVFKRADLDGKTINLKIGDTLNVMNVEHGGASKSWNYYIPDENIIRFVGKTSSVKKGDEELDGSSVNVVFHFNCTAKGTTTITFSEDDFVYDVRYEEYTVTIVVND